VTATAGAAAVAAIATATDSKVASNPVRPAAATVRRRAGAVTGYLDLRDEGYGFLRMHGALQSRDDAYVSVRQVRQFGLRRGDHITGASRPAGRNEKNPALLRIDSVNGRSPDEANRRPASRT
jgi:transcription termination factor Rho